jgi:hypothetical protein
MLEHVCPKDKDVKTGDAEGTGSGNPVPVLPTKTPGRSGISKEVIISIDR